MVPMVSEIWTKNESVQKEKPEKVLFSILPEFVSK